MKIKGFDPVSDNALELVRAALNPGEESPVLDFNLWPDIKKELKAQAVLPLVSDYILKSDIPKEDKYKVLAHTAANIRFFHKLMNVQQTVCGLFEENGIKCAVMKGAAAAKYYPKPELRSFGDIDILVLPENYDRAIELLSEAGYEKENGPKTTFHRHTGFTSPEGVNLEIHRRFSVKIEKKGSDYIDGLLYEKLPEISKPDVCGFTVPVFPEKENGLVLLSHVSHHLTSGLGLRQVIDWQMFVRSELDDAMWNSGFREEASKLGLECLAVTMTRMCQLYLGLDGNITWCRDADEQTCAELMAYILKNGNFGTKTEKDSNITRTVIHHFSNPVAAVKYLYIGGIHNMEKDGHKAVGILAIPYQILHLCKKGRKRKTKASLGDDIKNGSADAKLLKKLKVSII